MKIFYVACIVVGVGLLLYSPIPRYAPLCLVTGALGLLVMRYGEEVGWWK